MEPSRTQNRDGSCSKLRALKDCLDRLQFEAKLQDLNLVANLIAAAAVAVEEEVILRSATATVEVPPQLASDLATRH